MSPPRRAPRMPAYRFEGHNSPRTSVRLPVRQQVEGSKVTGAEDPVLSRCCRGCCGLDLIPHPGTSICCPYGQEKEKRKEKKSHEYVIGNFSST